MGYRVNTAVVAGVAASMVLALSSTAQAQQSAAVNGAPSAESVARAYLLEVDKGFVAQAAANRHLDQFLAAGSATADVAASARMAGAYEDARAENFRAWARGHQDTYRSVTSELSLDSVTLTGDSARLSGTVETTMLWSSSATPSVEMSPEKAASFAKAKAQGRAFGPGDVVTSKVQTRHDMRLRRTGGAWLVVTDRYLDPFDLSLDAGHVTPHKDGAIALAAPAPASVATPPAHREIQLAPALAASTMSYNRSAAATYADRYWSKYNTWYPNCNPSGGDCANFVSQALWDVSGGDLPTESPYWTPGSFSSCAATSKAWRYTPSQHSFFVANPRGSTYNFATLGKKGTASVTRAYNIASMLYGDVIFDDWTSNGGIDHVTIAAAYASDGSTLVDAHNTNHYHYRWDMGTSSATYYMDHFKNTITY